MAARLSLGFPHPVCQVIPSSVSTTGGLEERLSPGQVAGNPLSPQLVPQKPGGNARPFLAVAA